MDHLNTSIDAAPRRGLHAGSCAWLLLPPRVSDPVLCTRMAEWNQTMHFPGRRAKVILAR
ncbi:hypothetical protein [Beijerinckia mobilis]|uniref:hypothetical protein n=1 Tax=Beijerinckia mobilis TaxID=231434 RepID=UPI0005570BCD|nr:hypothetical protein [Beijerinckia mobilis]